jgi:hypothetical protein
MTERQLIALRNPAIEAEDCVNQIYRRIYGHWSTLLTLNSGFE